jgi:paraquat-inducible protein B
VPASLEASLTEVRQLVAELRGAPFDNLNATLASARAVVDDLRAAQLAERLGATLTEVDAAVAGIGDATAGVPALVDSLRTLSTRASELPLEELVASGTRTLDGVEAFLASEGVQSVPPRLAAALEETRAMLAELRAGGAVANVNATLASTRTLADELAAAELAQRLQTALAEAEVAAANVSTASDDLPALIDNLTALSERTAKLPLEDLVATGTRVLGTADAFLASEGVESVPPRLAAALEELRAILAELREGGAVANVNATLGSADRAANAVTEAAAELPALVAQLSRAAQSAEVALASVGPSSDINRDTLLLLREVREAARSVNSLVTALERRPNSVLFGR